MTNKSHSEIRLFCQKTTNNWKFDGNNLICDFEFNSFLDAIDFVNEVAKIASNVNHHPQIYIDFKTIKITLYTHDTSGITQKDFDLANEINKLKKKSMEWYMKNRWWIWSITGVYLVYRLFISVGM